MPAMNEEIKQAADAIAKANDPLSVSYATYAWVIVLSMWGGIVRIFRELRFGGKTWVQILLLFLSELSTSGFAGLLTFYACTHAGINQMHSAVMVGMSGYMGGRALTWLEQIYKGSRRCRKEGQDA